MDLVLVAVGLALLLGGGEALVRGGLLLAARWRWSPVLVGAVVLGFGTSTPELFASLSAAWAGAPGIAVGNVVGSNIANILLILGLSALIAPIPGGVASGLDRITLALATLAVGAILMVSPQLGRLEGAALLLGIGVYLWLQSRQPAEPAAPSIMEVQGWKTAVFVLGGLLGLVVGAALLVAGATNIARDLGVPETVIGLTLVAVGTSLPELATSVSAARRGQAGLVVGNVIGSNIFNLLAILGLTAISIPIPVPPMLSWVDLFALGASALLLLILVMGGVRRWHGVVLLASYGTYLGWLTLSPA